LIISKVSLFLKITRKFCRYLSQQLPLRQRYASANIRSYSFNLNYDSQTIFVYQVKNILRIRVQILSKLFWIRKLYSFGFKKRIPNAAFAYADLQPGTERKACIKVFCVVKLAQYLVCEEYKKST